MIDKSTLVKNLNKIQKKLCAYTGFMCDCKYGADSILESFRGEDSGCPEILLTMSILNIMTDKEYEELLDRRMKFNAKVRKELMELNS